MGSQQQLVKSTELPLTEISKVKIPVKTVQVPFKPSKADFTNWSPVFSPSPQDASGDGFRSPRREPSGVLVAVKASSTQIITDSDPAGPRLVSQAHKLPPPPSPPPPAPIGAVLLKNVNNLFKNLLN